MHYRCPHCLDAFESDEELSWSEMNCPSCGSNINLANVDTTCTYSAGVQVLGRFELLRKVGEGRSGSVWKARDTQLQRMVAVKIPRQLAPDPHELLIFLRDARAAAQLKHPRIASVHEVGRENDTVYIVTDFIDGANLGEWLSGKRMTSREAAELVIKISEALHHAHEAGIVHRDLKPGNIMMDRRGEPHVIDFGLARREIGEETVTVEGQLLGTPSYMPPEQARGEGHWADRRSDIYSLGVILFRVLTRELPFRGAAQMLIVQILNEEPPSPRKLDASVPRDLETITLKCLEKEPSRRYPTALALADDLRRFLAGEPIQARPVGSLERGWRWCKRKPTIAALSASLLLLLSAVSLIAPIVAVHEAGLRRESELRRIELQNQVARNLFQRASEEYNAGRLAEGIALLAGAYRASGEDKSLNGSIRRLLSGWSSQSGRPIVHDDVVLAAALSPDGRTILIGGHNRNRTARLWNRQTLAPLGDPLEHADSVRAVAFSPSGEFVLTGCQDRTARLWDARTGIPIGKPLQHAQEVWAVAISPDNNTVVTGGKDNSAQLWDARTGERLGEPFRHENPVVAAAFSPDGRSVLTGSLDKTAQIWDVGSHQPAGPPIRLDTAVYSVDFSPNGREVLTGSFDGSVQFWDAHTLQAIGDPMRHENNVYAVAYSPDGRTVLTGSFDTTARLWDVHSRQPIGEPLHHGGLVMSVAFSPDGRTALTGSADRTARLWNISDSRILPHKGNVSAAVFSPNGRFVLTGGDDHTTRLWDAQTGDALGGKMQHDGPVLAVMFSPDGKTILSASSDRRIQCWNTRSGEAVGKPWELRSAARKIDFCNDGQTVAVRCMDETLEYWDFRTGQPISDPLRLSAGETLLAISPDGQTLLVRSADGTAQLQDSGTQAAKGEPLRHKAPITAAAFSGDGRLVVTGGYDQDVRRWDAATGKAIGNPCRHEGVVDAVTIGQSGRIILTGSKDRTARLWDSQTGMALGQTVQHPSEVSKVALSPDERLALTLSSDGSVHLWDVASCKPLARPLQYEISVTDEKLAINDAMFSPDGSAIVFQCVDGTARLYHVPQPLPDDPPTIRARAQTRSGFELDENSLPRQLSQADWLEAQQELAALQKPE